VQAPDDNILEWQPYHPPKGRCDRDHLQHQLRDASGRFDLRRFFNGVCQDMGTMMTNSIRISSWKDGKLHEEEGD
jgi:hypothetical protein